MHTAVIQQPQLKSEPRPVTELVSWELTEILVDQIVEDAGTAVNTAQIRGVMYAHILLH